MLVTVVDDHRFRAMGTRCHVQVVDGPPGACDLAEAVVRADEARWSRFDPASELRRVVPGATTPVSAETGELLALALDALDRTDGWFDPRLGHHLGAAGYDRTIEAVRAAAPTTSGPVPAVPRARPTLSSAGGVPAVTVPLGVGLDLGGIAKGHSADRALEAVLAAGALGACVNLGGDLRCAGQAPGDDGWWCALDHGPGAPASDLAVGLAHGAVATSTTRHRRWATVHGSAHHLLDPRTGRPADTDRHTASVVAPTTGAAEVLAKVALLGPWDRARSILHEWGAAAIVTTDDGTSHQLGPIEAFLAPTPVGRPCT